MTFLSRSLLGLVFLTYFIGTAGLFFFGPWRYDLTNGAGALVWFLVGVHVAFGVGYVAGISGRSGSSSITRRAVPRLVLVGSLVDIILLFPTSALNTGSWIPSPWAAAGDLAGAYTHSLQVRDSATPYVNYVRILVAPLVAAATPLGVVYWRELGWAAKIALCASVVGTIVLFVAMGANAGAGHWMAMFPWFVLGGHLAGIRRLNARGWFTAGAIQAASVVLFAGLFAATMMVRSGSYARDGVMPGIGAVAKTNPVTPPVVPPQTPAEVAPEQATPPAPPRSVVRVGSEGLAAYLTQGYFGVYLSLQEPFVPCYGVGNSMFLQRQVARILQNPAILSCPYVVRIEHRGWKAQTYWATIYPWIASDVSFPGTVLVMLVVGWIAGRVWLDVLGGRSVTAVAALGQILLLLYYVPAHNKVMHSGEGVVAFVALVGMWWWLRRRDP